MNRAEFSKERQKRFLELIKEEKTNTVVTSNGDLNNNPLNLFFQAMSDTIDKIREDKTLEEHLKEIKNINRENQ